MQAWAGKANAGLINHEPHSEHLKMRQSPEVEQQIDEEIHRNRMIMQWQFAKETGVAFGTVNKMIKKLNHMRICVKWVPQLLTDEVKAVRKETGQQLLAHHYQEGEWFLRNIVTEDEPWIGHYDPLLKRQSTEYHHPSLPHHKKILTRSAT